MSDQELLQAYQRLTLEQIEREQPNVPDELYRNLGEVTLALWELSEETPHRIWRRKNHEL